MGLSTEAFVQRLVWLAVLAAHIVLVMRLVQEGLTRRYRMFTTFLLAETAQNCVLFSLPWNSNEYAWTWILSEALISLFYLLVLLELYGLVLEGYPGIATTGKRAMLGSLALAVVISGFTLMGDISNQGEKYPELVFLTAIERGLLFSLVLFLLLIAGFLVYYPVPLRRNVIVHATVYFLYFFGSAASLFYRNVTGHEVGTVANFAGVIVSVLCLGAWICLLDGEGETLASAEPKRPPRDDEQRVMEQLNAINAALSRAGRSVSGQK